MLRGCARVQAGRSGRNGHVICFISSKLARRASAVFRFEIGTAHVAQFLEVAEAADAPGLVVEVAGDDSADDAVEHPVECLALRHEVRAISACELKLPRRVTNSYDAFPCLTSMSTRSAPRAGRARAAAPGPLEDALRAVASALVVDDPETLAGLPFERSILPRSRTVVPAAVISSGSSVESGASSLPPHVPPNATSNSRWGNVPGSEISRSSQRGEVVDDLRTLALPGDRRSGESGCLDLVEDPICDRPEV